MRCRYNKKGHTLFKRFIAGLLVIIFIIPFSLWEIEDARAGGDFSSKQTLDNIVTDLKSYLYNDKSDQVQNNDVVFSKDIMKLNYEFSMNNNQVSTIKSAMEADADYGVYINIPDGLKNIDKSDKPVYINDNDGKSQQMGTLVFDPSEHGLFLHLGGDFWIDGENINSVSISVSCQLDMDKIGNEEKYKIELPNSADITIKNGESKVVENQGEIENKDKDKTESNNSTAKNSTPVIDEKKETNDKTNDTIKSKKSRKRDSMPSLQNVVSDLKNGLINSDSDLVKNYDTIYSTDSLQLYYEFSITEEQVEQIKIEMGNNSNYSVYVQIPDGLKTIDKTNKPIYVDFGDGTSQQIGTLVFDPSQHGLYLRFEGDFWDEGDIIDFAYIYVSCELDMDAIGEDTSFRLDFIDSTDVTIQIGDPLTPLEIEKEGEYDGQQFTWKATYKPGTKTVSAPITIIDTFDNTFHNFVDGSLMVDGVTLPSSSYQISNSGTTTTIKYQLDTPPTSEMVLTYKTELSTQAFDIDNFDKNTTVSNDIKLQDSDNNELSYDSASATATADDKSWLRKDVDDTWYDEYGTLDWSVTVMPKDLGLSNLVLHDTIPKELILDTSSIRINGNSLSFYGAQLTSDAPDANGTTYHIIFPSNGSYDTIYEVTYTTTADEDTLSNIGQNYFSNKAWLTFDWIDNILIPPIPEVISEIGVESHIIKKYGTYNRSTHTITWEVEVNPYLLNVTGATITDDLTLYSSTPITFVPGSFSSDNDDVTLDTSLSTNKNVVVNVGNIGTEKAYFYFDTLVDNSNHYAYNSYNYYYNTVNFEGKVQVNGSSKTISDQALYDVYVPSEVVYKYAVYDNTNKTYYDYGTNTITWQIRVNNNAMPMSNAVLEDTLPSYLELVDGSVCIGPSQNPTTPAPNGAVSYVNKKLTVTLGNINSMQYVVFKTKVDVNANPAFKDSTSFVIKNSINLIRDGYNNTQSSYNVTVNNKVLGKNATVQDNNKISYAININGNDLDISDCTLTDTLPTGLKLDFDSVKLWEASVAGNGTITKSNTEVTNFTLSYNASNNSFSIKLPSKGRYVLTYDCYATSGGTYKNDVVLEGGNFANNVSKASVSKALSGGGAVSHIVDKGNLSITKLDSSMSGVKLAGVTFELWTKVSNVDTFVEKGTTDANGKLVFNILNPNREYWLVESGGISGYEAATATVLSNNGTDTIPLNQYKFYITANATKDITIYNKPSANRSTDIIIDGTKNLANKVLEDDAFSFVVEDEHGNVASTGTNRANGKIVFSPIHYTAAGTYQYKVSELTGNASRITYDKTIYNVKVDVVDIGGTLSASVTYLNGNIVFNNKYVFQGDAIKFTGRKNFTGGTLVDNMFSFMVKDDSGNIISVATNKADGTIDFGPIQYTAAGTYNYKVSEVGGSASGITYDKTEYNVSVNVVENSGILVATVNYPDGDIVFNNTYTSQSAKIDLVGKKNLADGILRDDMFSFIVKDEGGNVVSVGTNKANGAIAFGSIYYTVEGTYRYEVSEIKSDISGISHDSTVYGVEVNVTNVGGVLKISSIDYPDGDIVFHNIYINHSVDVQLAGTKDLIGKALTDNMFSFIVEDEGGHIVSVGTNKADGTINFGSIHYTAAGTHNYKISEVIGNESGVTYDVTVYDVKVDVTDDGSGNLTTNVTYTDGNIVFNNSYVTDSADIILVGKKNLANKSLEDNMFSFIVQDEKDNIVSVGTNKADGAITFGIIHHVKVGTYLYKVSEVRDSGGGIIYDTTTYNVKVDVVKSGGTLKASATYVDGDIVFNNKFLSDSAEVIFTGKKNLIGKDLKDGVFSFIVKDENGNVVSVGTNRIDGTIAFGSLHFTELGTYQYKVSEIRSGASDIVYDKTVSDVEVDVVDIGGGILKAAATYIDGSITYDNAYVTQGDEITLVGTKNLVGKVLQDNMFKFIVKDEGGNTVSTGTNKADGTIEFESIRYTAPGTYNYKVSEVIDNASGMKYDETVYNVKVDVADNGGILDANATYINGNIIYNNAYITLDTEVKLTGKKNLTGKVLEDDMFNFVVKDENGNKVSTGTNKANGTINFNPIRYTAAGIYRYTVSEVKGNASGIKYDKTVYNVTVQVVEKDGELKAKVKKDKIVFNNSYRKVISDDDIDNDGDAPETGDRSMLYGWIIVFCISMFLVGTILWLKYRKKRSIKQ